MGSRMSDLFLLLTVDWIARVMFMLPLLATSRAACLPILNPLGLLLSTDFPFLKFSGVVLQTGERGSDAAIIPPIDASMFY